MRHTATTDPRDVTIRSGVVTSSVSFGGANGADVVCGFDRPGTEARGIAVLHRLDGREHGRVTDVDR